MAFVFFSNTRDCKSRGGGVGLYAKTDLNPKLLPNLSSMRTDIECIFVEVTLPDNFTAVVGSIYRPRMLVL